MEKVLGRIASISLGMGGYQDAMFGLTIVLHGGAGGCTDFHGFWASKPSEGAEWSINDQDTEFAKVMRFTLGLIEDAKVKSLHDLKGVPAEMTFDNTQKLIKFRILTEVIG